MLLERDYAVYRCRGCVRQLTRGSSAVAELQRLLSTNSGAAADSPSRVTSAVALAQPRKATLSFPAEDEAEGAPHETARCSRGRRGGPGMSSSPVPRGRSGTGSPRGRLDTWAKASRGDRNN